MILIPAIVIASLVAIPADPVASGDEQRQIGSRATTDETITVQKGMRVAVDSCFGDLTVRAWERDAVRVQSSGGNRSQPVIRRRNQEVTVDGSMGPLYADVELTVPAWIELQVSGVSCMIDVQGVSGNISASSVEGDIALGNVSGAVKANTIEGSITVDGGTGRLDLNTTEEDILIRNFAGEVAAESVDGNVIFVDSRARAVEASTIDGDIRFTGTFVSGGRYLFTTHDGDVWLGVPANVNASIGVRIVADGEINSTITLPTAGGGRGRRRLYTLGNGSAQVEVEVFDGTLHLRRPEDIQPRER